MTRRLPWLRSKPAEQPNSEPRLPSLNLLLQIAMQERDKQLAQFDALDTKAGVLLGFDGVLIVISHGIDLSFQLPGVVLASASAALALATFWPRKFPALDPWALRQFLTYKEESTRLKLHDTVARSVTQGRQVLSIKARSLKQALTLLLLAALTFGAGTIATTYSASTGRTHHGTREPAREPAPQRASASPSAS